MHPIYSTDKLSRQSPQVLAICIVIVDQLHHEAIWRRWLEHYHATMAASSEANYDVRFYIHAKRQDRLSDWVRQRLIPENFMPEWNSPEVVRAMLALLKHALADDGIHAPCQRFVFATESCVPIFNAHDTCTRLFASEASWLDARHEAETKWERLASFDAVDNEIIPREAVWKALPGWIMLTRKHAEEVY